MFLLLNSVLEGGNVCETDTGAVSIRVGVPSYKSVPLVGDSLPSVSFASAEQVNEA